MTERTTLARPYAEAVFRLASGRGNLPAWSGMLQLAASVARDPQMAVLADNPRVPRERFVAFFLDVCGDAQGSAGVAGGTTPGMEEVEPRREQRSRTPGAARKLDTDAANFIRLLSENRRLVLLPEIAALYEALRANAESRIEAEVVSASEVSADQIKTIAAALTKRLGREVNIATRIDPALVGGIVIRAGDLVIDGSVRGKLRLLATHLNR
jgi:F-type H+-transporting ATPase subunit delta